VNVGLVRTFFRRHSVTGYFALTFLISWSGALAVAATSLVRGGVISKTTGLIIFPVMLLGPA
jgi:uncharacterized protein